MIKYSLNDRLNILYIYNNIYLFILMIDKYYIVYTCIIWYNLI